MFWSGLMSVFLAGTVQKVGFVHVVHVFIFVAIPSLLSQQSA
jgi:hypothetical protein